MIATATTHAVPHTVLSLLQGVDLVNERLVYACSGLAVEPGSPAAAIAAAGIAAAAVAEQQQARPDAVVTESGALVDAVPVEGPVPAEGAVPVEGAVTDAAAAADPAMNAVPVERAVAEAAAADPAAVADAVPAEGAVTEAAVADPAAGAKHHHHHHHHRHLLQAGTEWVSTWKVRFATAAHSRTSARCTQIVKTSSRHTNHCNCHASAAAQTLRAPMQHPYVLTRGPAVVCSPIPRP